MGLLRSIFVLSFVRVTFAACPSSCSGHGDCGAHDVCSCWKHWTGSDCSLRACPYGVSWQTSSDEDLKNAATPNYPEGFRSYAECSDRGICDQAVGQCHCFNGFEGKACRRSSCSNKCSGHGRCVFDAEIDRTNYWNDGLLHNQKQYWNGYKTQQCICDRGWWGYDCSQRLCPEGQHGAGEASCAEDYIDDIQLVTVTFNNLGSTKAEDIEQFFSLEFTDMFSGTYQTRPISYWADTKEVQEALRSLPDNAIPDVEIMKVFPLAGLGSTGTGLIGEHPKGTGDICAKSYRKYFQDTTCLTTKDCTDKFPFVTALKGVPNTRVFCDISMGPANPLYVEGKNNKGRCVETETNCEYKNGKTEFEGTEPCAVGFEPDGVYTDMADKKHYWGRQLTANEKQCQVGPFDTADPTFTSPGCKTDADCKPCAGWTNAVAGTCDAASENCVANTVLYNNGFRKEVDDNKCNVASFFVIFSHSSTPGEQQNLKCTVGAETNFDGSSPRYKSSSLSCDVTRVSKNMWKSKSSAQQLCFYEDSGNYKAKFEDFQASLAGTCRDNSGRAYSMDATNKMLEETNHHVVVKEMVDTVQELAGQVLFQDTFISPAHEEFLPSSPCSAQGDCDVLTGSCTCAKGFEGDACQDSATYQ